MKKKTAEQQRTKIKCTLCDIFLSELVTSEEDLRLHDELWHKMGHIKYFHIYKMIKGHWMTQPVEKYLQGHE